jgi:hypothetical protein
MAKHFSQSIPEKVAEQKPIIIILAFFSFRRQHPEGKRGLFSDLFFIAQHLPVIVFSQELQTKISHISIIIGIRNIKHQMGSEDRRNCLFALLLFQLFSNTIFAISTSHEISSVVVLVFFALK